MAEPLESWSGGSEFKSSTMPTAEKAVHNLDLNGKCLLIVLYLSQLYE